MKFTLLTLGFDVDRTPFFLNLPRGADLKLVISLISPSWDSWDVTECNRVTIQHVVKIVKKTTNNYWFPRGSRRYGWDIGDSTGYVQGMCLRNILWKSQMLPMCSGKICLRWYAGTGPNSNKLRAQGCKSQRFFCTPMCAAARHTVSVSAGFSADCSTDSVPTEPRTLTQE